jgi:hypothetical protein
MLLLLMVVFFMVPMLVVIAMYKFNWKPTGDSYGKLVKPPHTITNSSQLRDDAGKAIPALLWRDKWSMVYISDGCAVDCQSKLHDMRQLHASLYKDVIRVQRVWVTTTSDVSQIKKNYPDMVIINQPNEDLHQLIRQFQLGNEQVEKSNQLYLVDPLGFYMMQYAADTPLANVRKDVVKLLKSSWAG